MHKKTLYQDGVPFITQQPIPRNAIYRYKFKADNIGTHFYHSHYLYQRSYGLAGPLIIRESHDKHSHLYQHDLTEHTIFIQDFGYDFQTDRTRNILINGKGIHQNGTNGSPHYFEVKPWTRYRFRIIYNGIVNTRIVLWINGMTMTLIGMDGHPVQQVEIGSLTMSSSERYDVIINTGNELRGPHWLHVLAYGGSQNLNMKQIAGFHYKHSPYYQWTRQDFEANPPLPLLPNMRQLSHPTLSNFPNITTTISPTMLKSYFLLPRQLQFSQICPQIFLHQVVHGGFRINYRKMKFPKESYQDATLNGRLNEQQFCNEICHKPQNNECVCEHVIKVQYNSCQELIIIGDHPFHVHGHLFYVLAEGIAPNNVEMNEQVVSFCILS